MTPIARSLAYAREHLGWRAETVERWNPHVPRPGGGKGIRQDLFGFADILCLTGGRIVAVQCFGGSGMPPHKAKIETEARAFEWLESGGHLELWAWRKLKLRPGAKALRWRVRRVVARLNGDALAWSELDEDKPGAG